jgi:outer membrane immunogenic protein
MRNYVLSGVALAAVTVLQPAHAADLARAPAPVAQIAPLYNWTGFYLGANGAYAFSNQGDNGGGFAGGLQIGGDYQFNPNWVIGIEGMADWASINSNTLFTPTVAGHVTLNNLASITGRIGYTWGPGLLYFKAGWGWAHHSATLGVLGVPVAFTTSGNNNSGYVLGGGLEWMFAPHWSAKLEYDYYGIGTNTFYTAAFPFGITRNFDVQTVLLGVNYRF